MATKKLLKLTAGAIAVLIGFSSCKTLMSVTSFAAQVAGETGIISKETANSISSTSEKISSASEEITPSQEYYIGRALAGTLLSKYKVYNDPELQNYLNLITHAITINSMYPQIYNDYSVVVLDTEELNAFSTSGGHILITIGMLKCAKNEDAIAAVIAHELAHIHLKHSVKSIKNSRNTEALKSVAGTALIAATDGNSDTVSLVASLDSTVGELITNISEVGYSQSNEYDADKYALQLMADAGYNQNAMTSLLNLIEQKSTAKAGFGKTHPTPKSRRSHLENEFGKYPYCTTENYRAERFNKYIKF